MVQLRKIPWSAESETTRARPSAIDSATTTSIPRSRSSSTNARTERPPAVFAPVSLSSMIKARRVSGRAVPLVITGDAL